MSKFFITNDSTLFGKIKNGVEASKYKISFECCDSEVYSLSTKKLAVDNENGIRCDDGFVIVTGTMAWGGGDPINCQSLLKIYEDFRDDVNVVRKKSIGNYAAILYKNHTLYVFGEIAGFYNIYYYNEKGKWLVSNSLFDMAAALKGSITLNKMALVEASVQDGILLGDTYLNEINRLSGFNHIVITNNELKVITEEWDYPMSTGSLEDKVINFANLQRNYGLRMSKAYGAPSISMTGGLDARMTMSSYLAAGVKPHLYYGIGNSFITNTFNEDKEIDEIFSNKFGLPFYKESWSTPEPLDKYWISNLEKYGFYYDTYAGSNDVVESIKNNPNILFTYGYCGELYRNLPWIEERKKEFFTLDEYINEVYITPQVKEMVVDIEAYYTFISDKQEKICRYYHLDPNHIASEDIFYLSLERRKSADSAMLNHVNLIKYCCYTIGQYESLAAGRVTCKEAENSGFMLRCLDALCPEVLDVPVFSHCTMRSFNRETMTLSPQTAVSKSVGKSLKEFIKRVLPFAVNIYRIVHGDKNHTRFDSDKANSLTIMNLYNRYDKYKIVNGVKFNDLRRLVNYIMKVYALDKLGLE